MDFTPSESQRRVQSSARAFAESAIAPEAAEIDRTGRFPRALLRGLAERGLLAVNVPAALGGLEAGAVAAALAIQEIARACASTAVTASVTNMVCETIAAFGNDDQRKRHCPRLASGDAVAGSFALSEPDAGSDPAAMRTTARRDGGGWVLDGAKQWITSGAYAGVLLVWARHEAPAGQRAKLSCFILEGGARGLSVRRTEDKMGIRGSNTVGLELDGCRVPADGLLGAEGGGFRVAMSALDGGRIGIASQAIGIARAALEASLVRARGRRAPGVPRGDDSWLEMKLADMRARLDAAIVLSMQAAWRKEKGLPFTREAAMAKLAASEGAIRVCGDAIAIAGGTGGLGEDGVERHFRDARVTTLYEGTSEIQRLVIARRSLA
ncbi:MAG TPA: acyl-CoA dehydrogenase family protein [Polyangiaceae bacterium]